MTVKELTERLQLLDPNLEVYIANQEETQLTQIDVVIPCVDYGEKADDNEEFVAIFPKTNSKPLFTLTAEEIQYLKDDLIGKRFCRKLDEIEINLLNKIKEWIK